MKQYQYALLIFLASILRHTYPAGPQAVLTEVGSKLGLGPEYVTSPCRLMPYVELSSLLTVEELRLRLERDPVNPKTIDDNTVKEAQQVYYTVGLHGMMYAGCMLTTNLGENKTRDIINKWVSEYGNTGRKQSMLRNFNVSISEGKQSNSDKDCLDRMTDSLRDKRLDTNSEWLVTAELNDIQNRLNGRKFTSAELKAATEAVAATCLLTTSSLSDDDKIKVGEILVKAANFFHHLEGGVIRVVIGDRDNTELINTLLRGILKARYLTGNEQKSRAMLVIDGESISRRKCHTQVSTAEECIENMQGQSTLL